jgi:transposase
MILPDEQIRVYLAVGATDMRKQIDGLAALVEDVLEQDPFSSALYAFCNQRRDKLKLLFWHRNGFWLWYRRLERGRFHWPRNIAFSVEHAPDIDMLLTLHVENQVWISGQRPGAQTRKVQLERVARRSRGRMLSDMHVGPFQCIDEAHGCLLGVFGHIVVEDLLDVAHRSLTGYNGLGLHPRSPCRTRLRKVSK